MPINVIIPPSSGGGGGASDWASITGKPANVTALAGVTSAANKLFYFTGSGTGAVQDFSPNAQALLAGADYAAMRALLDVYSTAEAATFSHNHAASAIVSGVLNHARVGTGSGPGTGVRLLTSTDGVLTWEVAAAGVTAFNDLSDVVLTGPTTAQVIRFNGTNWVNATLVAADISDLNLTPETGEIKIRLASPINGDVSIILKSPIAFTIDNATHRLSSGSITTNLKINSTSVTGLSAVSPTSSRTTTTATAANSVAVDDEVVLTLSGASSPGVLDYAFKYTRT